ncbi:hypothetical protein [Propionibacterium sp.]|uniref:hypothetical protein n=1 Tax=Propionibacterium sp. TaxID=1977903 RepID=UPI0039EB3286
MASNSLFWVFWYLTLMTRYVVLPLHYCFGASLLHTHLRLDGSVVLRRSTFLL